MKKMKEKKKKRMEVKGEKNWENKSGKKSNKIQMNKGREESIIQEK